eukprot:7388034-Prymnesium_polylepis.3
MHQLLVVVGRQVNVAGDADGGLLGERSVALARHTLVRVCLRQHLPIGDRVVEGERLRGAVAAAGAAAFLRVRGAIDKLLRREV